MVGRVRFCVFRMAMMKKSLVSREWLTCSAWGLPSSACFTRVGTFLRLLDV